MSIALALDLTVDDAVVLQNSNELAVRLLPCDVLARVAPLAQQVALFELELAQRLAETESPVAALEPRVKPRAYGARRLRRHALDLLPVGDATRGRTGPLCERAQAAACRHAEAR